MTNITASGSSPFTWKIGTSIIFAMSVAYIDERASSGQRGETDLIVDDHVHRAAGAVAVQLRHVERFRHDPLARESRVAVNEQRQNFPPMLGIAADALPGARVPSTTGSTASRWLGIRRQANLNLRAGSRASGSCDIRGDISRRRRPRPAPECSSSLNSVKITLSDFLQEIREHIEPAAMRHAHANFLDPARRDSDAESCRE